MNTLLFPYPYLALSPVFMRVFRHQRLTGGTPGSSVYLDLYGQMSYNF